LISEDKIKEVLGAVLGISPATIGEDFSSDSTEAWDSLRHMNLILALEEEFNVSIPDEDVGGMTSYKIIKVVLSDL
jgi:acyl carrier protein